MVTSNTPAKASSDLLVIKALTFTCHFCTLGSQERTVLGTALLKAPSGTVPGLVFPYGRWDCKACLFSEITFEQSGTYLVKCSSFLNGIMQATRARVPGVTMPRLVGLSVSVCCCFSETWTLAHPANCPLLSGPWLWRFTRLPGNSRSYPCPHLGGKEQVILLGKTVQKNWKGTVK